MYALKARDKLHKREKEYDKETARGAESRARKVDRHHRDDKKQPATSKREAKYIGTFSIEMGSSWKKDMGKTVKQQLSRINTKHPNSCQLPVSIMINMEGVKVLSADGNDLIMAHAVKRIMFCTADTKKHLFVFVAKNPETGPEGVYSHVFLTAKKEQASELSEIVGKAFKATFAKQTLTRDKKKKKGSSSNSPWTVVNHSQSASSESTGATSLEGTAPTPSAPTPSAPTPTAPPVQRQPWTVQPTSPTYLAPPGTHAHSTPSTSSAAASLQGHTREQLLDEAGRLESEVGQLRTRVSEIEDQMRELASFPEAVIQLTEQLSLQQLKLDEKRQRLSLVHERLQELAASDPGSVRPPAYPGTPSGFSGGRNSTTSDDLLPDFDSLSLEDAEWFQAGLPRELAMEILSQQPEGSFIVRSSSSNPGSFALSLKGPQDKITHYLIDKHGSEYKLQGSGIAFPSMMDLIYHHCFERGPLPCTLNLGVANPAFLEVDGGVGGGVALGGSDSDNDDEFLGVGLPPYHLLT